MADERFVIDSFNYFERIILAKFLFASSGSKRMLALKTGRFCQYPTNLHFFHQSERRNVDESNSATVATQKTIRIDRMLTAKTKTFTNRTEYPSAFTYIEASQRHPMENEETEEKI